MTDRQFEVTIYYTTFCSYRVEAKNEEEAIVKARNLNVDEDQILTNMDNWEEADTVEEINHDKRSE